MSYSTCESLELRYRIIRDDSDSTRKIPGSRDDGEMFVQVYSQWERVREHHERNTGRSRSAISCTGREYSTPNIDFNVQRESGSGSVLIHCRHVELVTSELIQSGGVGG